MTRYTGPTFPDAMSSTVHPRLPDAVRMERVNQLIDDILRDQKRFDMGSFFDVVGLESRTTQDIPIDPRFLLPAGQFANACGTTMCIAGFATMRARPDQPLVSESAETDPVFSKPMGLNPVEIGREWLGLSPEEAWTLFYATDLDATGAIQVLRDYAEKGFLDDEFLKTASEQAFARTNPDLEED